MKVLFVSSEVVPWSKTGGLADVSGSLPKALAKLGIEISIVTPYYKCVKQQNQVRQLDVKLKYGEIFVHNIKPDNAPVYFISNDKYFDRDELYFDEHGDFKDNCERFSFFCQATIEMLLRTKFEPDIIHCHDWQTALLPAYLKTTYSNYFRNTRSVITVHNLSYQGLFESQDMTKTGLDWKYFNWKEFEYYGKLNLLKGGLVFSDAITTVSPTYAEQIKTPEFGCGLDGVLRERQDRLTGILNGVDYSEWDPSVDKLIPFNYSAKNLKNKNECKKALQKKCGLVQDADVPLVGMIGRLAEQKGLDILVQARNELEQLECQFVILGSGEPRYVQELQKMGRNTILHMKFDNKLAHEIEAGADIFLMPSRFEPCGLNQIYSMRYGTVPVVHRTGGLADTVTDTTPSTLNEGTATGFTFDQYSSKALVNTLVRAILFFKDKPKWQSIIKNCMSQDFSWNNSAHKYIELYNHLKVSKTNL